MAAQPTSPLLPPYLPPSKNPSAAELLEAADAAACAADGLAALLSLDERQFWAAASQAQTTSALGIFVDTYLRFAPRRLGFGPHEDESDQTSDLLRKRLLRVLLRLATPPSSAASISWSEQMGLWFSAPRLLDIHALYGFSQPAICERILSAVLSAQPRLIVGGLCDALGVAAITISRLAGYSAAAGAVGTETAPTPAPLPLPSVADLSSPADVEALASWLQEAAGTLHALLAVAPASILRESATEAANGRGTAHVPLGVALSGPQGLLTALQLSAEAALPRLRQAAGAASSAAAVHDSLAAAGIHCVHAAALLASKALIEPAGSVAGEVDGRGGGRGKGKGGGRGKGKGGKGKGGGGGRLKDSEEMIAALLQLSDPCEILDGCADLYAALDVPTAPASARTVPQRLVQGGGSLLQQMLGFTSFGEQVVDAVASVPADAANSIRQLLRAAQDEPAKKRAGGGGGNNSGAATAEEKHKARHIMEMLPGVGEGFVVAVLRNYGGRTEPAVNALLEDNLPSHLAELPRDLRAPPSFGPGGPLPPGATRVVSDESGGDASGGGRRTDTLGKRRVLQNERKLLGDLSAPGRRAPTAVLEAAAMDDSSVTAGEGGGGYAPPAVVAGASLGLYDDEFDDSLEAFSAGQSATGPSILADDLEEAAFVVRRGGHGTAFASAPSADAQSGGGGGGGGAARGGLAGLPANALEWVRSIGLGQYAEKMRAAGLVRLELAAQIGDAECDRLKATPAHRTKLLASAARLAERFKERGRPLPGQSGGGGGDVYAAAAQLHYDAETGTFWDEEGGHADEGGGGAPPAPGRTAPSGGSASGRPGGGAPINPALARRRAEANKAKVANHSRKQAAARKQQKAGGF